jgi:Leucine-rich repeat (LRR) protein
MYTNDPKRKLAQIHNDAEKWVIQSLMDIISGAFGFNFIVANGTVVELQMVACGLSRIPKPIVELPNLIRLHLEANQIKSLRYLDQIKTLKQLDLKQNLLEDVSLLATLPNLQILNVAENRISTLQSFSELRMLESLDISRNQITELIQLPHLNRLKNLDISVNPITSLTNLHTLESLNKINLQGLQLTGEDLAVSKKDILAIKQYCQRKQK